MSTKRKLTLPEILWNLWVSGRSQPRQGTEVTRSRSRVNHLPLRQPRQPRKAKRPRKQRLNWNRPRLRQRPCWLPKRWATVRWMGEPKCELRQPLPDTRSAHAARVLIEIEIEAAEAAVPAEAAEASSAAMSLATSPSSPTFSRK